MADNANEGILKPGDVLNNTYVIAELVASGGTGEVYRATNRVSGREIAIKILKEEFAQNEQFTDLMKREASVLHEVIDPSVVRYYDLLESDLHDGFLFIVMEFIHGPSLADNMRRSGPLAADLLLKVAKRILLGLKAAHDKNAFHRDLSPDNVILRDDDPMQATLIDFGIAKDVNEGAKTVVGDGFAGKYQYAAPEQMEGNADGRSDLYSLGMTLIGAYRGQSPSAGSSLMQIVRAKADKPDISDLTGQFHDFVSRLVEPNPEDRFASADAALAFFEEEETALPFGNELVDSDKTVFIAPGSGGAPKSVPPAPVLDTVLQPAPPKPAAMAGSEDTIERIQQSIAEPKQSKTGLWAALALLLLGGGGFAGWQMGLFGGADSPVPPTEVTRDALPETEPPKQAATAPPLEDINPDLEVPKQPVTGPQTDTTGLQAPDPDQSGAPDQLALNQDSAPSGDQNPGRLTPPSQEAAPSTAPAPQQDPNAAPTLLPGQMAAPTEPGANPDARVRPDTSPGKLTAPGRVTNPTQTPDVTPKAAPTVLPVAKPYRLTIERTNPDDPLLLSGNLPSAKALAPITTILEDQLDVFAVKADIKPASGMPSAGWDTRIVAIALNFARLDKWQISAVNNTVTLSANARNAAEHKALLNATQKILDGTDMKIEDRIAVLVQTVDLATVNNGLQQVRSCGPLRVSGGKNGALQAKDTITVQGNLARAGQISAVLAYLNEAAPGRPVINDMTVLNDGVCAVLQVLPDQKSNKLRIDFSIGNSDSKIRDNIYHLGQNPVIDIAVDARAEGYMTVIFIDQSNQVFHLLPHQARKQNLLQSIGEVRGNIRYVRVAFPISEASVERLGFKVVEPLGSNMIVAVVTPDPLFNDLRPRAESNAAFVAAVKNKLVFADESDGIVTFRSLVTKP